MQFQRSSHSSHFKSGQLEFQIHSAKSQNKQQQKSQKKKLSYVTNREKNKIKISIKKEADIVFSSLATIDPKEKASLYDESLLLSIYCASATSIR